MEEDYCQYAANFYLSLTGSQDPLLKYEGKTEKGLVGEEKKR
ncbi:MAG TPA: hypothetical protein VLA13_08005 [Massilibacterium sp.]|nr:hypothetical protein [Massilibacterium sp.]